MVTSTHTAEAMIDSSSQSISNQYSSVRARPLSPSFHSCGDLVQTSEAALCVTVMAAIRLEGLISQARFLSASGPDVLSAFLSKGFLKH